jgi:VWFA-related protein
MGIVIDNSGSMRDKVEQVRTAALSFVKVSNPQDESFVVNFNDEFYLDTVRDFTSDINELRDALDRIDSRGSTGLYDALIGSLDHLKKGRKDKKVILVISDGLDNASRRSLEDAVREAQRSDAVIYAIGIFSDDDLRQNRSQMRKARGALDELTTATGGLAFFPDSADETEALCTQIAHDIRNQYTLGYSPTNLSRDGKFRQVKVELNPPKGMGKLTVRTRTGYFPRNASAGN